MIKGQTSSQSNSHLYGCNFKCGIFRCYSGSFVFSRCNNDFGSLLDCYNL